MSASCSNSRSHELRSVSTQRGLSITKSKFGLTASLDDMRVRSRCI